MMHSDRSWMKPKRALPGGQYLLDRWGRLLPMTDANRARAVMLVRVKRKRSLVTPDRAVARFRELCAEAKGE